MLSSNQRKAYPGEAWVLIILYPHCQCCLCSLRDAHPPKCVKKTVHSYAHSYTDNNSYLVGTSLTQRTILPTVDVRV